MKRFFSVLLLIVVIISSVHYAVSEDLSAMSTEDLLQLRKEINIELSSRENVSGPTGKTVIDIFPDKEFALYMRDALGVFSINDEVTSDMLEQVSYIFINDMEMGLSSLEGIQFLPSLKDITCIYQSALTELPEIGNLQQLYSIDFSHCGLTSLPKSICNCTAMEEIDISCCPITELPDDIGNLSMLKKLDISYTKINELPATIRTLKLTEFKREGLELGE